MHSKTITKSKIGCTNFCECNTCRWNMARWNMFFWKTNIKHKNHWSFSVPLKISENQWYESNGLNTKTTMIHIFGSKTESQNVCYKKTKHAKFSKKRTFLKSGGKKCSLFGKFDVLWFLVTPVLRFDLLPHYRRYVP